MRPSLRLILALGFLLGTAQALLYQTHSINNMALLRKFLWKGLQNFKIDVSPLTLESCQKYTRHKSFPFLEQAVDETIGCYGLLGDFSNLPYAHNRFDTTEDLLDLIKDPQFREITVGRQHYITFQLNFLLFGEILPEKGIAIDFLDRLIDLMEANPYLRIVLNHRFPERLAWYCHHHPVGCAPKIHQLKKIMGYKKFFCEYTYTWPQERQVFNDAAKWIERDCARGFTHSKSLIPFTFWEYNSRTFVRDFLRTAELNCPAKNGHEIQIASNFDLEFFEKVAYLKNLDPPKDTVYQVLSLGAGYTRFLGQQVVTLPNDDNVGVHVSDSEGGAFNFQFFRLDPKGSLVLLNQLHYIRDGLDRFISVTAFGEFVITFFQSGAMIHRLSQAGGKLEVQFPFHTQLCQFHADTLAFDPVTLTLNFLTVTDMLADAMVLSLYEVNPSRLLRIGDQKISLAGKNPVDIGSIKFRVPKGTKTVYFAFDFVEKTSTQVLFGVVKWGQLTPQSWKRVLGSLVDFALGDSREEFALLVGNAPEHYGHEAINNNNLDGCSSYLDFEKRRLRPNMSHANVYYYGKLQYIDTPSPYNNGEDFVSICDPGIVYGLIGNSFHAQASFIYHAGERKMVVSEQPALVRHLDSWTNLWAAVYDLAEDTDEVFVFQIRPHNFFPPTAAPGKRGVLSRSQ